MDLYSTGARAAAFSVFLITLSFTLSFFVLRVQTEVLRRRQGPTSANSALTTIGQRAAIWGGLASLAACVLYEVWGGVGQFVVDWRYNDVACEASVLVDVGLYGVVKVLLYLFLAGRALVVITLEFGRGSIILWANLLVLLPVAAVLPFIVIGRLHDISSETGTCRIGERRYVTAVVLGWDILSTVYLSLLFATPLIRHHFTNPHLRRVAVRSLVGGLAALVPSTINIALLLVLVVENFRICYMLCGADVAFQSLVVFILTQAATPSQRLTSFEDPENFASPICRDFVGDNAVKLESSLTHLPSGLPAPAPSRQNTQEDASIIKLRLSNQFIREDDGGAMTGESSLTPRSGSENERRTSWTFP